MSPRWWRWIEEDGTESPGGRLGEVRPPSLEVAEAEALQRLSGRPAYPVAELQKALRIDGEAFIATWEGRAALPRAARRRLIDLLDEERRRIDRLRDVLERHRKRHER